MIFEDLRLHPDAHSYGYLSLMFEIFHELTDARKRKNLTQAGLAMRSGIARPAIARMEAGRANPTLYQIIKLGKALDLKIVFKGFEFEESRDYEGFIE